MKIALYTLGMISFGILIGLFSHKLEVSSKNTSVSQTRAIKRDAIQDGVDAYGSIYKRLGLQSQDTLYEINGVKVPEGFASVVEAYQRGDLCITYKRDVEKRRVCFSSDEAGERVQDIAANE
jgi:hypothetical protein